MTGLPAGLEASALMRRVQADGGFAAVLKRGDADRGMLLLLIRDRGHACALLQRGPNPEGRIGWIRRDPPENVPAFMAREARFDPDFWLIELDIPDSERFIAETIAAS